MANTLLLGSSGSAWHEWLNDNRKGRDVIVLDPADAHYGAAARLWLLHGDRASPSFYGSTDPQRAPHLMVASLARLIREAGDDAIVQLFGYRPTPLLRQLAQAIAFFVRPEIILLAEATEIGTEGWPVGPELIELPAGLPQVVIEAQRKAQWLKLLEHCQSHQVPLASCSIQGTRLGSGSTLDSLARRRSGLDHVLHAEVCGGTLLIVLDGNLDEDAMSQALDVTHAHRAQIVHPGDYDDLLCALMRSNGDEFGYGMIERIDFAEGLIYIRANAIPPVPVPVLRIGSLKVDADGRERGEAKPWQV